MKQGINEPDLSLMIPIYNEEDCLEEVVEELIREIGKLRIKFELFLVNNGSTDNSQVIIGKLKKEYPEVIRAVIFKTNQKLGGAVNKVTADYLKGKVIGFTCADGEVSAKDTVKLVKLILDDENVGLAKTVRLNRFDGFRLYISKIYNLLANLLFGIRSKDINGWPVLIRHDIFKKMHMGNYSWIFQLEYLYQIRKMNKKFVEIDVQHQRRRGGASKVNISTMISFTLQMILYRIRTLR